jgi:hypothetical protein
LCVSREKKGYKKTAMDFILASKALPVQANGASLFDSNVSVEHFTDMLGSDFANILANATCE